MNRKNTLKYLELLKYKLNQATSNLTLEVKNTQTIMLNNKDESYS